MKSSTLNLVILGKVPPPRGGCTTHIERLLPYLNESGIEYVLWYPKLFDMKKAPVQFITKFIQMILLIYRKEVVVLHNLLTEISLMKVLLFSSLKLFGVRITFTLVTSPEYSMGKSLLKRFYMLTLAMLASHIVVATNRHFYEFLVSNKIPEDKLSIIPSFIPCKDDNALNETLPDEIMIFCSKQRPLIVSYAHGPDVHNGEDVYGLDLLVALAKDLKKDYPDCGLIVFIPEVWNKNYYEVIRSRISEAGVESSFYFANGGKFPFVPVFRYADLFIRATSADGDALTLREAIYYGVTSVASDVCNRPEKTILFKNRDAKDLCRAVRQGLADKNKMQSSNASEENNAYKFIKVFKKVAGL